MIFCWKKFAFGTFTFHFIEIHDFSGRFPFFSLNSTSTDYDLNLNLRQHGKFRKCSCVNIQNGLDHVTAAMYGDQCTEGSLDDDTLVFHLDVDSHATSGHWQVCALWILSTSRLRNLIALLIDHIPHAMHYQDCNWYILLSLHLYPTSLARIIIRLHSSMTRTHVQDGQPVLGRKYKWSKFSQLNRAISVHPRTCAN